MEHCLKRVFSQSILAVNIQFHCSFWSCSVGVACRSILRILSWSRCWPVHVHRVLKALLVSNFNLNVVRSALLYMSGCLVHLINRSLEKLGLKFNVQFPHFVSEFLVLIVLPLLSQGILLFLLFKFEFSQCTQVFHPFCFLYRMLFVLLL